MVAAATGSKLANKMRVEAADNRSADDPYSMIFSKCRHGHLEAVQEYLAMGVAVDGRDKFGNTPLMVASQNGKYKVLKFLVKAGCNVNLQNGQGNTALHFCMAYGHRKLGELLLKQGADTSIRNRAGKTCYEGLEGKARAEGEAMGLPVAPEVDPGIAKAEHENAIKHAVNSAEELAAIKVKELKAEIQGLKESLADEQNRVLLEIDRAQEASARTVAAKEKQISELMTKLEVSGKEKATLEAMQTGATDQLLELQAQVDKKTQELEAFKAQAEETATFRLEQLESAKAELTTATTERDQFKTDLGSAQQQVEALTQQVKQLEAAGGSVQAESAQAQAALADLRNKWSEEVVARKKFEDNLFMKTKIADRLDSELEALRPKHEQLEGDHAALQAKADGLQTQLSEVEAQSMAVADQLAECKAQLDKSGEEGASKENKIAELEAQLANSSASKTEQDAALIKLQQGHDAQVANLKTEIARLKEQEAKLAAAEQNAAKLSESLAAARKASQDLQAGAATAANSQITELKEQAAAELEGVQKQLLSAESKTRLAEQELKASRQLVVDEQQKAERALKVAEETQSEMNQLKESADARAKMLQGCVDAERQRYGELEGKFAEEKEKSAAAAELQKANNDLKSELEETKAKLATLWSQFLGGK